MDEELDNERRNALEKAEYFGIMITAQRTINNSVRLSRREYERFDDAATVILGELYKQRSQAFELYFTLSLQAGGDAILQARKVASEQFVGNYRAIHDMFPDIASPISDDIMETLDIE